MPVALQSNKGPLQVDANGRADWHDYAQAITDGAARGPGEQGLAVELPKDLETEKRKERLYKVRFKMNLARSIVMQPLQIALDFNTITLDTYRDCLDHL